MPTQEELKNHQRAILGKRNELGDKERDLSFARAERLRLGAEYTDLKRRGKKDTPQGIAAKDAYEAVEDSIKPKIDAIGTTKSELRVLDATFSEVSSEDMIALFSDRIPILLMPVRLETRFMRISEGVYQLWVRIYPDQISVETHESLLTEKEYESGVEYIKSIWRLGKNSDPLMEPARLDMWKQLTDEMGQRRGAWVARAFLEGVDVYGEPLTTNLDERPSEPPAAGDEVLPPVFKSGIKFRPGKWSEAAESTTMPDRFVLTLYRVDGSLIAEELSLIPHPLKLSPAPHPEDVLSGDKFFDSESAWLLDFDEAIGCGMGHKFDITEDDWNDGFTRIIALGIKSSADADSNATILEGLLEKHHYSRGLSFVPHCTPSNNVKGFESGFSRRGREDMGYAIECGEKLAALDGSNGKRVADFLGINKEVFNHVENADGTENGDVAPILRALWPATWGYFLEFMMGNRLTEEKIEPLKRHYVEYVRGRGAMSAMRTGNQPYGLLVMTDFSNFEPSDLDSKWLTDAAEADLDESLSETMWPILKELKVRWEGYAADPENVPMAGVSPDPEEEMLKILAMEGGSATVRLRPTTTKRYLWNLLRFMSPSIMPTGFTTQVAGFNHDNFLNEWAEGMMGMNRSDQALLDDLGIPINGPPVIWSQPWGAGFDTDKPLIEAGELSGKCRLKDYRCSAENDISGPEEGADPGGYPESEGGGYTNYIDWILNKSLDELSSVEGGVPSETLLFNMLSLSAIIKHRNGDLPIIDNDSEMANDLKYLSELSTAKLEQLLTETLDLSTNRLDGWLLALVTKRLEAMRREESKGVYLGAFGWLEDLKRADEGALKGGFIHCPSESHASSAAVIRSAYLTHQGKDNFDKMSVNFTSDRVRNALDLIEGTINGQELSALTGYRFERSLHEGHSGLELDRYIATFRELYPITEGESVSLEEEGHAEAIAARNVVNGEKLVKAWKAGEIPFGDSDYDLPRVGSLEYDAILKDLDLIDDAIDAVGDVELTESVYQCMQGNFERGGEPLTQLPEVVRTPRAGISQKLRMGVAFSPHLSPLIDLWPVTERGKGEPVLDRWVGQMIGDPAIIRCNVSYPADKPIAERTKVDVSAKDLLVGPLDFLEFSISQASGEASELEMRILYHVRETKNIKSDVEVEIVFEPPAGWPEDIFSFPQALEFARSIREVITDARAMEPSDMYLSEEAAGDAGAQVPDTAYSAIEARARSAMLTFSAMIDLLKTALDSENLADIRTHMMSLGQFSLQGAVPVSAKDDLDELFNADLQPELDNAVLSPALRTLFLDNSVDLSTNVEVLVRESSVRWLITDHNKDLVFVVREEGGRIRVYEKVNLRIIEDLLEGALSVICEAEVRANAWEEAMGRVFSIQFSDSMGSDLNTGNLPEEIKIDTLSADIGIVKVIEDIEWLLTDNLEEKVYNIRRIGGDLNVYLMGSDAKKKTAQAVKAIKALLGESFRVLIPFAPVNREELSKALADDNTTKLLDGEHPRSPVLWLQQCAVTHPKIRGFETMMMEAAAFSDSSELRLRIGKLPYKEEVDSGGNAITDRWMSLPFKDEDEKEQGTLSLVLHTPYGVDTEETLTGLVIDDWDDLITGNEGNSTIAYHYNGPNSEPPQTMLLAVPPKLSNVDVNWSWENLLGAVNEALDLANVRAVDLDAMQEVGRFFPALYMPYNIDLNQPEVD